jgi:hypothetical protein
VCKQLLGKIRNMITYTIFDELDATQDFKACEVNFTEGRKLPIDKESILPLDKLIEVVSSNEHAEKSVLAKLMLTALEINANEENIAFATSKSSSFHDIDEGIDPSIYLIRAILTDDNIFSFVCNKRPSTHFGVRFKDEGGRKIYTRDEESNASLLIAVPYEGTNTPKGLSTFDNTEVAAIATLRYYQSADTLFEADPHLDFLIAQAQKRSIPDEILAIGSKITHDSENLTDRLNEMANLLDKAELEIAKTKFFNDFLKSPTKDCRRFFGMSVVACQVRSDEARANSNRYEMGNVSDKMKGCSGTVGSTSSYFEKPAIDPAADGKLSLEIMGRESNKEVKILREISEESDDYLSEMLDTLLESSNVHTRAIIDAAGICKSLDGNPLTIAEMLFEKLKTIEAFSNIEGIVFYGRDNVKRLYRGKGFATIACNTSMELNALAEKKYFSFYGQKNTRGSDIKQADGAHALVTMDENVTNSDAKQAVLRFRSLVQRSSGQTFSFALTKKYSDALKKKKSSIDARDVSLDLRIKEKDKEEKDALSLFTKELKAHVKQAAAYYEHAIFNDKEIADCKDNYLRFLEERNQIINFVEMAVLDLKDKYGHALISLNRDTYIESQKAIYQGKLTALHQLAKSYLPADDPLIDDENQFFVDRIEWSVELFKSRYPKEKVVEISSVDTGAEAVAMALAEAQAEALAETIAERINETISESLERIALPSLSMDKQVNGVDPDWIENPYGHHINTLDHLKPLIKEEFEEGILISPQLRDNRMVSFYALVAEDGSKAPLLISQNEAEAFQKSKPEDRREPYKLYDLREENDGAPEFVSILSKAMFQMKEDVGSINSSDDLRSLELTHIQSKDLLPRLQVSGLGEAEVGNVFDLSSFGINREQVSELSIKMENGVLTIGSNDQSIAIPTQNRWISNAFNKAYSTEAPNKLNTIHTFHKEASRALREQKQKLEQLRASLERNQAEAIELIQGAISLEFTPKLRQGLIERDRERSSFETSELLNCGQKFISAMDPIISIQRRIQNQIDTKDYQHCEDLLNELVTKYESFRSPDVAVFNFINFLKTRIFDETSYGKYYYANKKDYPFDLVYGRILHTVHAGGIQNAQKCHRGDCNEMFNVFIPQLGIAMQNIEKAQRNLPSILRQISDVEAQLRDLEEDLAGLGEADTCIKEMIANPVKGKLFENGLILSNQNGDNCTFWDRLKYNFIITRETEWNLTFKTSLPKYLTEIYPKIENYRDNIRVLSAKEKEIFAIRDGLAMQSGTLMQQIENRNGELTFS